MKKFLLLHYGFEPPTREIMDAWNNWFVSTGDKMVDRGGTHGAAREITHTETKELSLD